MMLSRKHFLVTVLTLTLMWALIVISISVLYDEYIILLQQVSHNLNSIQDCYSECCMTTITSSQQSHTQTTWTENSSDTPLSQLQKLKRDTEHNECQRKKWWNIVWNNYACTAETMITSLKTATSVCCTISHHQCYCCWNCEENDRRRRTQKSGFCRSCSWEHMRCDKSWKKFENQMNSAFFTMSTLINKVICTYLVWHRMPVLWNDHFSLC
jgi:hypothetical protein